MKVLVSLLEEAIAQGASDCHISGRGECWLRKEGRLYPFVSAQLAENTLENYAKKVLSPAQFERLILLEEQDAAAVSESGRRLRLHFFWEKGQLALACRILAAEVPTLDTLSAPPILKKLAEKKAGLILMVGASGMGKSTSLAAMIGHLNEEKGGHIVMLEDPIEYVLPSKKAFIRQREMGRDIISMTSALKAALREDPDVVVIGELRESETAALALRAAETGHCVMATLHARDSVQAIQRMIEFFEGKDQSRVQARLADTLEGVIAQRLVWKVAVGARQAEYEILLGTPAIRALIREGQFHQIASTLQMSRAEGMQAFPF